MTEQTEFSVVVPVEHGGEWLDAELAALRQLDYPDGRYEVLIAVGPDHEADLARMQADRDAPEWPVQIVRAPRPGRAVALNAACRRARGRVLAFADDDCRVPPGWLRDIEKVMQEQPDVDVVGGVDQLYGTTSSADKASDFVLNSLIGTGGARSTRGGGAARCHPKLWNMAVKRKTALRVARGPEDEPRVFDERLPVHGDIDLCIRIEKAGGRTLVTPEISVEHRREMDFKLFLKRNFQMARVSRLRGMHRLAHRVLSTAAVTEAVLLAASIGLPALRPLAFGLLALYGMVLLGGGVVAAIQKRDPAMMVLVPIVLAGLHASRAIGYLWPGTPGGNE